MFEEGERVAALRGALVNLECTPSLAIAGTELVAAGFNAKRSLATVSVL
jgi:hypothetical protein